MKIINYIIQFFKRLKRRFILAKGASKMEAAFKRQLVERQLLRKDVNAFLKEFFGIDAHSKYIPKDFKNADEVRVAVTGKFQSRMDQLNVSFDNLFK